MKARWELARPGNAAMTGAAVALAAYAAGGPAAFEPAWRPLGLALTGLLFAAGANSLNDATDAEVDRRAHADRPVPSGRVAARSARAQGHGLLAASFLPTAAVAPAALWVVAVALALELLYEHRWKRLGLAGNATVAALTAAPFALGSLGTVGVSLPVLAFALLAALATLGRELLKDLEDAPHDEGRSTLAQRRPIAAGRAAAAALVGAVLLSPLPALVPETVLGWAYLAAVVPAGAAFLAAAARWGGVSRAQRVAKLAMLLALVALALGRLHGDSGGAL